MKMNNTTKILLGVAVGVGVAYLMYRRNRNKGTSNSVAVADELDVDNAVSDVMDAKLETREEQIAYILQNTDSNLEEETSGFEGVEFVWNEKLGKFYPKGTLTETKEPAFYTDVFYSADGSATDDPTDKAEEILSSLSDKEVQLAYNLVKYRKNNPKGISEEQAFIEIGGKDPKVIEVIKMKIKPKLNDIKALRKHPRWKEKWQIKRSKYKSLFDKAKKCGRRPINKRKMNLWNKCVSSLNTTNSATEKNEMMNFVNVQCGKKPIDRRKMDAYKVCVRNAKRKYNQNIVQTSDVKTKELFNESRQEEFAKEVANRRDGAIFGGKRWDGRTNTYEETLVREGI